MIDPQLAAFALVAAALTLTPGVDTLLVLRNTARDGRGAGAATTWGICTGLLVHALLSVFGLSVLLTRSAVVFHGVKLAGAGYLVWIGVRTLSSRGRGWPPRSLDPSPLRSSRRRSFREGLTTNVLNPKVAVFYLAFLPQFLCPGEPVLERSLLLAGIHIAETLVWLTVVSLVAGRARRFFAGPRVRRGLEAGCGALLVGFGLRLAFARR